MFCKLEDFQGEWAKELKIFARNAMINHKFKEFRLFLNGVLINHSCAPNAYEDKTEDGSIEVRAIKDISKGEEITIFYRSRDCFSYKEFGCNAKERMTVIKDDFGFDCKCCVCIGDVPDQEDIIKELLELHENLDWEAANESEEGLSDYVQAIDKIVDLNLGLYIGSFYDKVRALALGLGAAYRLQDADRMEKAMNQLKKIAEETKLKNIKEDQEQMMRKYY